VGGLKPLLDRFGNESRLTVIVYTLDETTYSRELAPLAGHYPALRLGPPWWFFDSPEGISRFYHSIVETAGFANTVVVFTACGTVTGTIAVSGLNGVSAGVGFTTRNVMYAVSPGASVTDASFGVEFVISGFVMFGFDAVNSIGFVMLATVIQCVCTPSTQFTATGV